MRGESGGDMCFRCESYAGVRFRASCASKCVFAGIGVLNLISSLVRVVRVLFMIVLLLLAIFVELRSSDTRSTKAAMQRIFEID